MADGGRRSLLKDRHVEGFGMMTSMQIGAACGSGEVGLHVARVGKLGGAGGGRC